MLNSTEKLQSPFLDVTSFPRQQSETQEENIISSTLPPFSPFVSVYEMAEGETRVDPESEEFIQFLGEVQFHIFQVNTLFGH